MFSIQQPKEGEQLPREWRIAGRSWTFCSFRPGSDRAVRETAEWLTDYAERYSSKQLTILTDFDERYRLFQDVEFPLMDIINGHVNLATLRSYQRYLGTSVINNYVEKYEKIMGDQINVSGSRNTIINRSPKTDVGVSSNPEDDSHGTSDESTESQPEDNMKAFNIPGNIVTSLGRIAGVAGIAFGVFLLLFKGVLEKDFLPKTGVAPDQAFHIMFAILIFTFGIAAVGILAWIIGRSRAAETVPTGGLALLTVLVVVTLGAAVFVGTRTVAQNQTPVDPGIFQESTPTNVWADPSTGLMWAGKDNGLNVNWNDADSFCRKLTIGSYSGWRLPDIQELSTLYDGSVTREYVYTGEAYDAARNGQVQHHHVKTGVELDSCCAWSSTKRGADKAVYLRFQSGEQITYPMTATGVIRALCVRQP
jgi:hypothetical protein